MKHKGKWIVAGVISAVLIGGGTGLAVATAGGDDSEPPITGSALERASAAALDHTGGGRVTDTEAGDEDAYYEVEVTLDNGKRTDVHLDKDFKVVSSSADSGEDEQNGDD
ncbi:PepSY domain-containing protein [Streptomyces cyaneochromogenes]|uniref:PepSY domain-containing protein n=1 Tax=Streptomyces cyaneochromogenes TaxID=2496836 RepID=A0A3Q9ENS1_9ACTN|nr:PepSY domain-containing protein [Streptomyces cyaneochromogenes]AZQ32516.1 PepSY domain-containing protein [Streptomyces cyaneochromogenes]